MQCCVLLQCVVSLTVRLYGFLAFATQLNAKGALFVPTGESFYTAALCVFCGAALCYENVSA